MDANSKIFNRQRVRQHRDRAAAQFGEYDFLFCEAAVRLADRLDDITRSFPLALDVGAHNGLLKDIVQNRGGIETLVQTDVSEKFVRQANGLRVACDEELLPFAPECFDAVLSVLSLQWVNDVPGAMVQINQSLKPDGLFMAVVPGANTLTELRQSALEVAAKMNLPLTPMVAPQVEVRDAGALLQRAGFALPVADSESVTVTYENAFKLFADLRGMGETNAMMQQHTFFTSRKHLFAIAEHYQKTFADSEGCVPATFEFVFMTGWKPHASQQQPAKRGSGKVNLENLFRHPVA